MLAAEATLEGGRPEAVPGKRKPLWIGGLVAVVVLAAGFAAAWSQAIWPLNQASEVALERRAQQFWDLKTSGDLLGAYDYMSETYRRRVTPAGFARQNGGPVVHTGAKVLGVEVDGSTAEVEIELHYRFDRGAFADMANVSKVKERWVLEGGAWYRWPVGLRG